MYSFMIDEEEVPDDPHHLGSGLEGMSSEDFGSFVLSESQAKLSQLSSAIVLCLRFIVFDRKSHFNRRQEMHFFRTRILSVSLVLSGERSSLSSLHVRSYKYYLHRFSVKSIPPLASLEKIL